MKGLLYEALRKGVLDSGCSKTVSGELWYAEFISMLSTEEQKKVIEKPSSAVFRFGDGIESKSVMLATIPVMIGSKVFAMDVDIVEQAIPLLISKGAMKQMGMALDFQRDVAVVSGQEINIVCTETGHYCMPVSVFTSDSTRFVLHVNDVICNTDEEKNGRLSKFTVNLHMHDTTNLKSY